MTCLCGIPLPSLLLVVVCYVSGDRGKNYDDDDYYDYDEYDYEKNKPIEQPQGPSNQNQQTVTYTIPCYTCHFIFQYDHEQGIKNCKDPFSSVGIHDVPCEGACAKVYRKLEGPTDFEFTRSCMPNCKEFRTETSSIECCTTGLCNGSVAGAPFNGCRTLATFLVALVLLLSFLL